MIAAGGTAGHVVPALAIAGALRDEGAEVVFAGGERAEAQLVPAAGYELEPLRVEGISRSNPLKAARAVVRAAGAVGAARAHPRPQGADAVLGGGGYVAGPVGLAAADPPTSRSCSPRPTHTSASPTACSSRAQPRLPRLPARRPHTDRYLVTGRAVPPTFKDRAHARARLGIPPDETCVLVFGGSPAPARSTSGPSGVQGRPLPRAPHRPARATTPTSGARPALPPARVPDPFGIALVAADAAVARAGGSVFELAQYGLPAVLIPYPHASADHQTTNARWMARGARRDPARRRPHARASAGGDRRDVRRPQRLRRDGRRLAPPRASGRRSRTSRAKCWRRPGKRLVEGRRDDQTDRGRVARCKKSVSS